MVALVFDGTLEGLMSAVFFAYEKHVNPQDIIAQGIVQPRLDQQIVVVKTDFDHAVRVRRGIERSCGEAAWWSVAKASAADDPKSPLIVYRFIRYALARDSSSSCKGCKKRAICKSACARPHSSGILSEAAHPHVEPLLRLEKRVQNEIYHMEQFIRFEHAQDDMWVARCNPNASVVPFIMDWFARRFNTQRFMIFDETHHIAGISEGGSWSLVSTDGIPEPKHTREEALMQDAWKRFYNALTIDARYNPELRRHFMPMRLWRNITEVKTVLPYSAESSEDSTPVLSNAGIKLSCAAPPSCQK